MKTNVFLGNALWLSQEDFSSHLAITHNVTSKGETAIMNDRRDRWESVVGPLVGHVRFPRHILGCTQKACI